MIFDPIKGTDLITNEEVQIDLRNYIRQMIPTARFWLMLKLRAPQRWEKRWLQYLRDETNFIASRFNGEPGSQTMAKRQVEKIERGAWNTMPSAFLTQIGVPRVQRF